MKCVFRPRLLAILAVLLPIMISGCVSHKPETDLFFDQWKAKAEESKAYTPSRQSEVSDEVKEQAFPGEESPQAPHPDEPPPFPTGLPQTPLSVRFIDDDPATSLRTMARIAHQNILISPSVQGKINLQTQDTPWETVFRGIINSYGLTVVKEDNLLHVMSMDDLKQQVERKSLQLQEQQVSRLVTKIVPIEFSDPKTISATVNQLLSLDKDGKSRGSTSVDEHTRSLIIRETEDSIGKLLSLVRELDRPTSQILIEAHIVETTKDTARELGIQWGALTQNGILGDQRVNITSGNAPATLTPATPAVPFYQPTYDGTGNLIPPPYYPFKGPGYNFQDAQPGQLLGLAPDATSLGQNVNLAASSISGINPATIGLVLGGKDLLLSAQLSALQRDGKLNILSSPSISTLDNSEAVIESGRSVPFQTIEDNKTQITYKDATLNLTVTPHVISDSMIKLNIVAKKDEVDTANSVAGNPFIIKKLAKTQLIVENNATVVLAGLSKETHSGSNTGVPGLKEVPGLGWMFKKDSKSQAFEELLIFITPRIQTRPGHAGPGEGKP